MVQIDPTHGRRSHRAPGAVLSAGLDVPGGRARTPAVGRSGRCSSTGCTSCPPPTSGSIASRCAAILDEGRRRWRRAAHVRPRVVARRTPRSAATCCASSASGGRLRARDLEDRAADGWQTRADGTTTSGRSVSMLLDMLWFKGEVMIVGPRRAAAPVGPRRAQPADGRAASPAARGRASDRGAAASRSRRGHPAAVRHGRSTDGPPGWERALARAGPRGHRGAGDHRGDRLGCSGTRTPRSLDQPWRPRTVAAVAVRRSGERSRPRRWRCSTSSSGWRSTCPKAKRRWGYFVLPILHGDRLIGRIDPRFDRETQVLHVNAVHAEDATPPGGRRRRRPPRPSGSSPRGWVRSTSLSTARCRPAGVERSRAESPTSSAPDDHRSSLGTADAVSGDFRSPRLRAS